MHTHHISGWTMNYNGDFSGDVKLSCEAEGKTIEVPFQVLAGLVAEAVRTKKISALQSASVAELLGMSPKS